MNQLIKWLSKGVINPEWVNMEKRFQKELVRIPRLYYYVWGTEVGTFTEIPTPEFQKLKNRYKVLFTNA